MLIDGKELGGDRAWVCGEIGHNHGGDLATAEKMVRVAAKCGVDAVKLQKRDNRSLYTRAFYNQPYNSENAYGPTYGLHREALELGWDEYSRLLEVASEVGVTLFATAFDQPSVDFCVELGLPAIKVASGDLTNLPLLKYVGETGLPILLSTGGGNPKRVREAVDALGNPREMILLQCTASYPCPPELLDLRVIQTYAKQYPKYVIGASLHFNGISMGPVAYALGARVLEHHFTLSRASKGTDHAFSLEPQGFRKLVRDVRRTELAMGDGEKKSYLAEAEPIRKMSKGLYSARPMPSGTRLRASDFVCKSPGNGLSPSALGWLVGKILIRDLGEEELIELTDISEEVPIAV